jgi:Tol biopolymer transport system component
LPFDGGIAHASAATRIALPTSDGRSPRYGPGYLLYIASKRGQDGIWRLSGDIATELWSRPGTRLTGAPAISPDGLQVAFTAERNGETRLHLMGSDGLNARQVAPSFEVRGTPTWAHDGRSLAVEVIRDGQPSIFRIPLDGGVPVPIVDHYSTGPQWSPTGEFLVYGGPQVGVTLDIHAVTPDGRPYRMPKLTLTRGAERIAFRHDGRAVIVLQGDIGNRDLVQVELDSGSERRLSDLAAEIAVADFDFSPDGKELILERRVESADQLLIERGAD